MTPKKRTIFYKIALSYIIAIPLNSLAYSQKPNFFTVENSDAIRDSINAIKFVNPIEAEKFAFEILEKYPDKKPNRVRAATFAALGHIYHIKGLTGPTLDYFAQSEQMFTEVLGSVPRWLQIDIGNIYFAQGLYGKAEESYQESFNNFSALTESEDILINPRRRSDRLQGMAVCKNNLAMIAEEKGEYDKAQPVSYTHLTLPTSHLV